MIKKLVLNMVKRYAVGAVQDAVKARGDAVREWSEKVGVWFGKARLVVAFLERLSARLADGELTDAEAERTVEEAHILAAEVLA